MSMNALAGAHRDPFKTQVAAAREWFAQPRFEGIVRLHTAREVAAQQGTIQPDYTVARTAAEAFYARLRELFAEGKQITTFGPYSPGQAVVMKRMGIEGIYLGGWATSAKGSSPRTRVRTWRATRSARCPMKRAGLVRALLTADKNQRFARARMDEEQRRSTPEIDFRPFIIADADTGHGGDAHVRNLIRRFVEVGRAGLSHRGPEARRQEVRPPGRQGAGRRRTSRTSGSMPRASSSTSCGCRASSSPGPMPRPATFLDSRSDERDQPFILGATNLDVPSYRIGFLAILKRLHDLGLDEITGHLLFAVPDGEYAERRGLARARRARWRSSTSAAALVRRTGGASIEACSTRSTPRTPRSGRRRPASRRYGEAVADVIEFRGERRRAARHDARGVARLRKRALLYAGARRRESLGISVAWDCELPKTPDGYYQVQGGIDYAIAKSLAAAPFADLLWMETKTADLDDARTFAEAIHAVFPDKMLAYNLSPSFNWDTTGLSDEEMRGFPEELGKLGFVFNFITYGGHQIDGLAAEEFATALREDGMLALARLQRKFRLLESPYRTPQSLVGGTGSTRR